MQVGVKGAVVLALQAHLASAALLERLEELEKAGFKSVPADALPYVAHLVKQTEGQLGQVREVLGMESGLG